MRKLFCSLIALLFVTSVQAQYTVGRYQQMAALLRERIGTDSAGIALLITMPDNTTYRVATGYADIASRTPLAPEMAFRIGSNTKTYTAALTLQLVDQGLLGLDDPITRWLPEDITAHIANSERITVRQLLNHTSGVFNYVQNRSYNSFRNRVMREPEFVWTPLETLNFVFDRESYFAPGEGWRYSNSNYDLLQLIIEQVTGLPIGVAMKSRLFDYLGMRQTRWETNASLGEGLISGYGDYNRDDVLEDRTLMNDGIGLAGYAGIISTPDDITIFLKALLSGRLLSPRMQQAMLTTVPTNDEGIYYGLGIYVNERSATFGRRIGHTGRTSGFASQMWYLPEKNVTLIIFANNYHTPNDTMNDLVLEALRIVLE